MLFINLCKSDIKKAEFTKFGLQECQEKNI